MAAILLFIFLGLPVVVNASVADPKSFTEGVSVLDITAANNNLPSLTTQEVITTVIKFGLSFVGLIALAILIYGGFLYITSAGDDSKVEHAKKLILYAVIGLLIIGFAAVAVNVTISLFKAP